MQKITRFLHDDLVVRAFHTFYQAFVPVFLMSYSDVLHAFQNGGTAAGKSALLSLLAAAGAAGISALKTLAVSYFQNSAPVTDTPVIDAPAPVEPQA